MRAGVALILLFLSLVSRLSPTPFLTVGLLLGAPSRSGYYFFFFGAVAGSFCCGAGGIWLTGAG